MERVILYDFCSVSIDIFVIRVMSQSFIALFAMSLIVLIRIMKYPDNKPLHIIKYRVYYVLLLRFQKSMSQEV
jgi:hypothetical protein